MNKKKEQELFDWIDLIKGKRRTNDIIELPVLSGSMMPMLIPGKKIQIKCLTDTNVKIGEIVVFKENKDLTAHRILFRFFFVYYYQKGDLNVYGHWINRKQIVGVVNSAQNKADQFIDLTSHAEKKQARRIAFKQLLMIFWNSSLIIPRKIKSWKKKD